jgi:nitrogen fixation NifU-like protein
MSGDLRELYQQLVFDHYKRPRNQHVLGQATHHAEGHNPLCGDEVTVWIDVADGIVRDVAFEGGGCAIATASASLMTEAIKGRPVADVERIFEAFHRMVTGKDGGTHAGLGKLEVLAGVREFPLRVKCATLAWHTLHAALERDSKPVSTE